MMTGLPLSGGVAMGRPCFYRTPGVQHSAVTDSLPDQATRIHQALRQVRHHYDELARDADSRLNRSAGDIFRAQSMLAADPSLIETMETRLVAGYPSAEMAAIAALDDFEYQLLSADSHDLRERASDIIEFKHALLLQLGKRQAYVECRESPFCRYGDCRNQRDHILIASQFMPAAALNAGRFTRGFVVEKGGPSSHAAILARMMGLPAVGGVSGLSSMLGDETRILVDGDHGRIYINPSAETLATYHDRLVGASDIRAAREAVPPVPGLRILADLDRLEDITTANAVMAEGIGLYRSENEVLLSQSMPEEDEQAQSYLRLREATTGPVYIRLLDLGSDKSADWLGLPAEENPALGCRGARLLLRYPEWLRTQARAIARASSRGCIHVIYPMVVSVGQYLRLREIFEKATADIAGSDLRHGVMLEVPAACLQAHEFFDCADFARIGSNDLIQYLFAADRMNAALDADDWFEHSAFWDLVACVVRAGHGAGKPVSLCGEVARNPKYLSRILAAGITEISTGPQYIADLRRAAKDCVSIAAGDYCSPDGQYNLPVS